MIFKIFSSCILCCLFYPWEPVNGMKTMSRMIGAQLPTFLIMMIKCTFSTGVGKQDHTSSGINFHHTILWLSHLRGFLGSVPSWSACSLGCIVFKLKKKIITGSWLRHLCSLCHHHTRQRGVDSGFQKDTCSSVYWLCPFWATGEGSSGSLA